MSAILQGLEGRPVGRGRWRISPGNMRACTSLGRALENLSEARLSGEWGEGVRLEARPESRRATVVFNLRAGGGF